MAPSSGPTAPEPAIVAEHTPNPHALKLLLGRRVLEGERGVDFPSLASASQCPLAARLLAHDGVRRVFVGPDFIAVTKDADASWRTLGPELIRALGEHFSEGRPSFTSGFRLPEGTAGPAHLSALERVLRDEIQPLVGLHGGDVQLVAYRDGVLELSLRGACADCPAATETLRTQIETRVRAVLPELVRVVSV